MYLPFAPAAALEVTKIHYFQELRVSPDRSGD